MSNWCCGEPMKVCGGFVIGGIEEDILECDFCGKRTDDKEETVRGWTVRSNDKTGFYSQTK